MVENREWLSLSDGEEIVWTGQPRLWRIVPAVANSTFWVLVFVAVALFGPQVAPPAIPAIAVTSIGLVLALASLKSGVTAYLRTRNVHYVLTTRNVYEKEGVWSTNVTNVSVTDIQNSQLTKDVLGNLFDYGSVAISTAGSEGADIVLTDLDRPETFREELQRVTSAGRERRGADSPTAGGLDAETVDCLVDDARALRESAERLETELMPG